MQSEMFHEIEQTPPAYLVVVAVENSLCSIHCGESRSRRELLEWATHYAAANMQLIRLVQIPDKPRIGAVQADPAGAATSDLGPYIAVFKRRERGALSVVKDARN